MHGNHILIKITGKITDIGTYPSSFIITDLIFGGDMPFLASTWKVRLRNQKVDRFTYLGYSVSTTGVLLQKLAS